MILLYIVLAVILLLIIFWIAPGIVCYRSIFGRHRVLPLDDENLSKPAIEPFKERMLRDYRYLRDRGYERVQVKAKDGVMLCGDLYDNGSDRTVIDNGLLDHSGIAERAAIDGSSVELFHNHAGSIDWVQGSARHEREVQAGEHNPLVTLRVV